MRSGVRDVTRCCDSTTILWFVCLTILEDLHKTGGLSSDRPLYVNFMIHLFTSPDSGLQGWLIISLIDAYVLNLAVRCLPRHSLQEALRLGVAFEPDTWGRSSVPSAEKDKGVCPNGVCSMIF